MKDNDFMASATAEEFLVKTGISESVSRVDLASSWCHGYPKFRLIFPFEFLVVLFCLPLLIVGGRGVGLRGNDQGPLVWFLVLLAFANEDVSFSMN